MSDKPKPFDDAYLIRDGWKRVKIYPYTTADGIERYQKLRYERPNPNEPKGYEKTFLIRRPDGNGGWYGEMGDERVLYRQQNIIDAPLDERVHIVQDRLARRMGVEAARRCPRRWPRRCPVIKEGHLRRCPVFFEDVHTLSL